MATTNDAQSVKTEKEKVVEPQTVQSSVKTAPTIAGTKVRSN